MLRHRFKLRRGLPIRFKEQRMALARMGCLLARARPLFDFYSAFGTLFLVDGFCGKGGVVALGMGRGAAPHRREAP